MIYYFYMLIFTPFYRNYKSFIIKYTILGGMMRKYVEKEEELILQSERFTLSNGVTGRIQIKEASYTVTLVLSTDCYRNLQFKACKKGIRVESRLNHKPKMKIEKTVSFTRNIENPSQFTEDTIIAGDQHYSVKIVVRLSDIARSDVQEHFRKAFAA